MTKFFKRGKLDDPNASFMERLLSYVFRREEISERSNDDSLYLRRYHILKTKWGGLYLHVFYRSDDDPDPHGHPWVFRSFILKGGYEDEIWVCKKVADNDWFRTVIWKEKMTAGKFATRLPPHIHRVRLLEPGKRTWTIVFLGHKICDWYFYTPTGRILGSEYKGPGGAMA